MVDDPGPDTRRFLSLAKYCFDKSGKMRETGKLEVLVGFANDEAPADQKVKDIHFAPRYGEVSQLTR